jgi:ABC-type phosphate transport system substrate-binding protein
MTATGMSCAGLPLLLPLLLLLLLSSCLFPGVLGAGVVGIQTLTGKGDTFAAYAFNKWKIVYPSTQVSRKAQLSIKFGGLALSGEGNGGAAIANIPVRVVTNSSQDFASTSVPLTNDEQQSAGGTLRTIPAFIGSVAIIFNLTEVSTLTLTREALVGIFSGSISTWNDARLVATNPALASVSQPIKVYVRSDADASTYTLTSALSSMDGTWAANFGATATPTVWDQVTARVPAFTPLRRSTQVEECLEVTRNPYSIGYVDFRTARLYLAKVAGITNRAGTPGVLPTTDALMSAGRDAKNALASNPGAYWNLVDGAGSASYPLAMASHVVLKTGHPSNCRLNYEVVRFVYWLLKEPAANTLAIANNYITLPEELAVLVRPSLREFRCVNGLRIYSKILADIVNEANDTVGQLFVISIAATCAMIVVVLAGIVLYWHRARVNSVLTVTIGPDNEVSMHTMHKSAASRDPLKAAQVEALSRLSHNGMYVIVHVLLLVLFWISYGQLPDGLVYNDTYYGLLVLGTVYTVVASVLMLGAAGYMLMNPRIKRRIHGLNFSSDDLVMMFFEFMWDVLRLVSVALLDLPMFAVAIQVMSSDTRWVYLVVFCCKSHWSHLITFCSHTQSIAAIVIVGLAASGIGIGYNMTFLMSTVAGWNHFWKARTIFLDKQAHLTVANRDYSAMPGSSMAQAPTSIPTFVVQPSQ